ncbi:MULTISPECIES: hypothetical protein [Nocardia]|jgi:hypothetical protein|uniref:Uncharacterized protein n=1 Tax=Nocardia nova TaxID=37330 RepID=A0A2S6A6C3_9NOCA|nr:MULTISPECIES: hypothetical protein [Nocardia]PPI93961.1 hypothetical protein C5E46_23375 [Nocardia nova]PPJ28036.1 hypothetical protein C5F51_14430 [Nocardia nova]
MTLIVVDSIAVLAQQIPITPQPPPGSEGLTKVVNWLAWAVMLAGIAALIYAGGKFGWERWHGGAVESPKIVLGALVGGIIATSAGSIMTQIVAK